MRYENGSINWVAIGTLIIPSVFSFGAFMFAIWISSEAEQAARRVALEHVLQHEAKGPHEDVDRRITVLEVNMEYIRDSLVRIEKGLSRDNM